METTDLVAGPVQVVTKDKAIHSPDRERVKLDETTIDFRNKLWQTSQPDEKSKYRNYKTANWQSVL